MLKNLKIYYILVSLPFVMLLTGAVVFFDAIKRTIISNPHPQINYTIFVIIISGGLFIILNASRLIREARILSIFTKAVHDKTDRADLQAIAYRFRGDIASLLQMVATSGQRSISHQEQIALEHELANARSRLTRRNALPQYLTGLLVGMGLVGTFIGLLSTLNDISVLISSFTDLDMTSVNSIEVFGVMIERMKAPMTSMGIAFSASLFGLLGSIVLGLMMVGIRRLEGDIFAVLSSEVGQHIEMALAFGSIDSTGGGGESVGGVSEKILLRIEERLAEAGRLQTQALAAEVEANNDFRNGLQQLAKQLGAIAHLMDKGDSELAGKLTELTANLAEEARVSQGQRAELISTITEQQEAGNGMIRSEVQQLGTRLDGKLDSLNEVIKEGNGRIATLMIERMVYMANDAIESKKQRDDLLRAIVAQSGEDNNFNGELKRLGKLLGAIFKVIEKSNGKISSQFADLMAQMAADSKETHKLLALRADEKIG